MGLEMILTSKFFSLFNSNLSYIQFRKEKKRLKGSSDQNSEPITYFVHMCEGVIIEVLRYGVRRRLTKLERVGHDFHLIVTNFFSEKPFVRFNLRLEIGY